ncbi:uncharacterized protein LOC126584425 [Malus sylvestris]|uniref:uncharacterized protein LOC126584425 n=1 Tax=Malus sylvestris TaxID=3752 RepID=UPI0021ACE786|nr:uncharacterized protein LOC126584425 [Malus sylvestris]
MESPPTNYVKCNIKGKWLRSTRVGLVGKFHAFCVAHQESTPLPPDKTVNAVAMLLCCKSNDPDRRILHRIKYRGSKSPAAKKREEDDGVLGAKGAPPRGGGGGKAAVGEEVGGVVDLGVLGDWALKDLKDLGVTDSLGWLQRECFISKSPVAKKREEEAEKLAEAATRKSEARRLADLEEKDLEKEEQAALEKNSDEVKKKQSRTVEEEEYERMVVVENKKRDDSFRRLKASFKEMARGSSKKGDMLPPRPPMR